MARAHRTYWIVRQRYRRAGYVGSLFAFSLCALWLVPNVNGAESDVGTATAGLGATIVLLLAAALIPSLVARVCWRVHRRRYFADIYDLGVV